MQPVRRRIRADPRAVLDREVTYGEPMASRIVLSANKARSDAAGVVARTAIPLANTRSRNGAGTVVWTSVLPSDG
jgi:hypothetical protein